MQTIRFGLIGGGLMGREIASAAARWCHLLDMQARPVITAVCSRRQSSLEWFTGNIDTISLATTDYKQVLASTDVDAVYIAVPHNLHEEMYVGAIKAGKHLLGEKPFGIDRSANAAILEAAARHPEVVIRCSSQFPFFPGPQRIWRFIKEGRIGRVIEAECGFLHSSDLNPDKPINWKRMVDINGEYGCMGDLGMHVLHIPLRAGWIPQNVRSVLSNIITERKNDKNETVPCETWDNAVLLCEIEKDGLTFPLTVKTMRIAPGETNTWYLSVKGDRLSARFSTKKPRTLETMPYEPGGPQIWQTDDLGYDSVYKTITGGIFEFGFGDAILQMFAAFCDQVVNGNDAILPFGCATPEETRLSHEILTAALQSQKTTQAVEVKR